MHPGALPLSYAAQARFLTLFHCLSAACGTNAPIRKLRSTLGLDQVFFPMPSVPPVRFACNCSPFAQSGSDFAILFQSATGVHLQAGRTARTTAVAGTASTPAHRMHVHKLPAIKADILPKTCFHRPPNTQPKIDVREEGGSILR